MVVTNGDFVTLYVDGSLASGGYISGGTAVDFSTGSSVRVGNTNGSDFFRGTIDDVRIYNRVLSAAEIKQLYNLGR